MKIYSNFCCYLRKIQTEILLILVLLQKGMGASSKNTKKKITSSVHSKRSYSTYKCVLNSNLQTILSILYYNTLIIAQSILK